MVAASPVSLSLSVFLAGQDSCLLKFILFDHAGGSVVFVRTDCICNIHRAERFKTLVLRLHSRGSTTDPRISPRRFHIDP